MVMTTPARIAINCPDKALLHIAKQLADQYSLASCEADTNGFEYLLILEAWPSPPGYRCLLKQAGIKTAGAICVDFCSGPAAHRRRFGGGRKQALARAIGLKPGVNPRVLDLTAGMGKDAFVLASLGCQVTLLERQPAIFLLLNNAIERALHDEQIAAIAARMALHFADSNRALGLHSAVDVAYLDPMYPARSKSALVKKEMRAFHDLVGQDDDADSLLHLARVHNVRRIVVKRPINASPLAELKPDTIISSKNTRYDIYLQHPASRSR